MPPTTPLARLLIALFSLLLTEPTASTTQAAEKPNVLFIAIDDLNDWVGSMDGHPQAQTPHIDRLATRGINFLNAHCQAPICQPSRTSLLTSTYPHRNGVYFIEQDFDNAPLIEDAITLPTYFKQNGYRSLRGGPIYHRTPEGDSDNWDESGERRGWNWMGKLVGPEGVSGLPEPSIFDFGPVPVVTEDMNDARVAKWAAEKLSEEGDQRPFFLAVGFITPHLPLFTPEAFYERFPLDRVDLPATQPGDLDDLPPLGRKFTRYFDTTPMSHHHITRHGLWKKAVASYLATSTFTDHCVGIVLDALEASATPTTPSSCSGRTTASISAKRCTGRSVHSGKNPPAFRSSSSHPAETCPATSPADARSASSTSTRRSSSFVACPGTKTSRAGASCPS